MSRKRGKKMWTDVERRLKECENCETCIKLRKNPERPVGGLPMGSVFNNVVALDVGELERENFIVMVDLATHCQGSWIRNKTPLKIMKVFVER